MYDCILQADGEKELEINIPIYPMVKVHGTVPKKVG